MTIYTDLITSEHANKPNFVAMVGFVTQAFLDGQACLAQFNDKFDIDQAVGQQQDVLGQWIGMPRRILVPLGGTYFSWDIAGLGWEQAPWFQTGNPLFSSVLLSDDEYRPALKARAYANRVGRSIYDIYAILDIFFNGTPNSSIVHDYQNMTMALEVIGPAPSANTIAILNGDYLGLRPAGVALLPTLIP